MKTILVSLVLSAGLALPTASAADPSFGFGLSYVFGGGGSDVAIGARIFSDDRPEHGAAALGLDYKFGSGGLRPTVGAAYLDRDVYGDFSLGLDMQGGGMDYGVGIGGLGGMRNPAPAAPVTPPAAANTPIN